MRIHVFKAPFCVVIGQAAARSQAILLSYRVRFGDEIEILTARVSGEDAPVWLLRQVENDPVLTRALLAHAAEDIAFDRRNAKSLTLARAA